MTVVLGVEVPDDQLARSVGTDFERAPELLDQAGVGYVVLGADRASPGRPPGALDPTLAGVFFARRTHGLGLIVAAAPQRDHPFNIARRTASLDHIARGRGGWLASRTDHALALGSPPHGSWAPPDAPTGAALLADAVTAARALWRTWPAASLAEDLTGRPPEAEVRYADHTGVYATTGPLNVPTTPQGEPVVAWDYRPGDAGRAAVADIAFVTTRDHPAAASELPDTVAIHVRLDGRDPELVSRISELASWETAGVLIRLDLAAIPRFVEHTVPALSGAGTVRLRGPAPALRDHLGVARRADPDPRRLRPVFASA
ncbi:alkanesulfonate monooxygenase SsuD/methylene tetrahydromethanopterin reductase-like flavin-dependent oxidoreductase (luciferase family) [Nocardia transvalensis]|uniref:Alkanesulfonate monooxygenase SsuD/methylene tetrahydromethanopterin reductase-like flavin-dependent oxidoreductase (Luciferase family) n=1 Tax=Nocardia transvalensis TaxID=37333 RepID=A0A7W9PH99_9NOCA|nr:LLM class flavin-dependent oxidoreductase [Nocardia transvalensis]MBB5916104.1 alkanesulfonate monooxygenase SsuD/methylene tetrahydromethanopterin reductase-like flavin-dependent oxidoreductase (luciferase family) [Nocardia transvalensis]